MIFVDSSFWIALALERDSRHLEAVTLLREKGGQQLVSTNHVMGETWTFVNNRSGHETASRWLALHGTSRRLNTQFVSPEQEQAAWRWLAKHDERAYSFVDATSFAVMRSLKVREALAFDGDFTAAGFTELRA